LAKPAQSSTLVEAAVATRAKMLVRKLIEKSNQAARLDDAVGPRRLPLTLRARRRDVELAFDVAEDEIGAA
jgi:hypothetical protein